MTNDARAELQRMLDARYSDAPRLDGVPHVDDLPGEMLARGSCRSFQERPVPKAVLEVLCAAALASPTKSDLQQRDIVLLHSPGPRAQLAALVSGQGWVADAPMIVVFCGNNRRQRLLHEWHDIGFANDHLDTFFNAAADAAIALGAFVAAADAVGLGTCPISAVRNESRAVSDLLELPAHVFPFAGLAIGYPATPPTIAKRLPLGVTCHVDRYSENGLQETVQCYDRDRESTHPYATHRFAETFGTVEAYGWSVDKARQYSQPERADFGEYIRAQGFCLE